MYDPLLQLDAATLLRQIDQLGQIGFDPQSGGRTRIAFSDAEKAGRDALLEWMRELELDIRIDQIGNIFGILPAGPSENSVADSLADSLTDSSALLPEPGLALMMGSHIDTVRQAGALDGCYGVLAGLAVLRAYRQAGRLPQRPLVVAAFSNEEGVRYQPDMMGSLVYAGGLDLALALDSRASDGSRLGDELEGIGYAGSMSPGAIVPREYLELHIEQGPVLEAEAKQIGVVENLQGISWQKITVHGCANHAGTTPTRLRHDAGYVAAACISFLREQIAAASGSTLATTGSLKLEPDVINVIPRKAVFTVDLRDPDEARLQAAEQQLNDFLADIAEREGVRIETERLVRFQPVKFDHDLCQRIETGAAQLGLSSMRMTSGAGHDAQMMARIAPAAMIFVPSRDGISHNPREHTDPHQLTDGAQLLLKVVQDCLAAH